MFVFFTHNTTTNGVGDIINTVLHSNMRNCMHNTAVGAISSSAVTISGEPQYDSPAVGGDADGFVLTQNLIDYDIDKTNITFNKHLPTLILAKDKSHPAAVPSSHPAVRCVNITVRSQRVCSRLSLSDMRRRTRPKWPDGRRHRRRKKSVV